MPLPAFNTFPTFPLRPLAFAALLACQAPVALHAQTLPGTASVINGVVDVQRFNNGVQVTNTPGAILHWDRFSIGAGNTVRFVQQNAASAVLNRVTGNSASQIHGALQSNGRVFLLNPNGILFGAGARVDVAGLLASTLDIRDQDFLDGQYDFRCFNTIACEAGVDALNPVNNRVVLQDGSQITTRTAGEGGQVWLIARDRVVTEKGSKIEAPSGQVMAATAREVSITSPSLGQMRFTLTGTAGSRIDLAGDIDAPRGAAGFFADNIRLAGQVHARSSVGAVGQIVAEAATDISVEGDARLDVSGSVVDSNAGSIHLGAEKVVRVAASTRIAADASHAGTAGAGLAGRIDLVGTEVILPGKLSDDVFSPIQVSARSTAPNGGTDVARSGRVVITETGSFGYTLVQGAEVAVTGNTTARTTRNFLQQTTELEFDSEIGKLTLVGIAAAGDGQRLAIIARNTRSASQEFVQQPFSNNVVGTNTTVYEAHVLDAQGHSVRVQTLATDSVRFGTGTGNTDFLPTQAYDVMGLSKGGWVVVHRNATTPGLLFVSPSGTTQQVDLALGTVRPLLAGGVLVERTVSGATVRTVFDAQGREVADAAALLAAEGPLPPQVRADLLNFDDTRQVRLAGSSAPNPLAFGTNLAYVDLQGQGATQSLVVPGQVSVVAVVNGTAVYRLSDPVSSDLQVRFGAGFGVATPDGAIPVAGIRESTFRSTADDNIRAVVQTAWAPLNSASVAFVTEDNATRSSSTVTGSGTTVTNSTETRDSSLRFNILQRTLLSGPAPLAQTAQSVVAPPLLAAQPGAANGVRGGLGTGVFPAEPDAPAIPPGGSPGGPTSPAAPTPPAAPTTPPNTSPNTSPTAGLSPDAGVPSDSRPTPKLEEIPPPPYQPPTRADPGLAPLPGLSVADIAKLRTGDVIGPKRNTLVDEELLESSRTVIADTLGPQAVEEFNRGTDAIRKKILDDARWAYFLDDKDLQAATRDMGRDMRGSTVNALAMLQGYGTLESEALDQGLRRALTVKVAPPQPANGSPAGPARTALETELQILESELIEAGRMVLRADGQGEAERKAAEDEHKRVTGRIARALVIAAREAAGEEVSDSGDLEIASNGESRVVLTEQGELRSLPQ